MGQKLKNEELGRLSVEEFKSASKLPVVIVLDNVRSLNNVGSVFRTADAFLIHSVVLCGVTGTPPHKEIEKTALGATGSVPWKYFKTTLEAIEYLRKENFQIYAVEQAVRSTPLNKLSVINQPTAFIFGNEVYGVEQEVVDQSDAVIEIPQGGTKHSLNIAVSVGVVLWEIFRIKTS